MEVAGHNSSNTICNHTLLCESKPEDVGVYKENPSVSQTSGSNADELHYAFPTVESGKCILLSC